MEKLEGFDKYYLENCNYLDAWFPGISFDKRDAAYEFDLSNQVACRVICITQKENFQWDIIGSSWWIEMTHLPTEERKDLSLDMKQFKNPTKWLNSVLYNGIRYDATIFADEEYEILGVFMEKIWYEVLHKRVIDAGLLLGSAIAGVDLISL